MRYIWIFGLLGMISAANSDLGAAERQQTDSTTQTAIFAAGCFWCMQQPFEEIDGVISTTVGYCGGTVAHPTYEQVSAGTTGHAESVKVLFDPARVSYAELLDVYWRNSDPTTPNRQFCDVGSQYRPAIFYLNDAQRATAEASKAALEQHKPFAGKVVTEIAPAGQFWPAEAYHQHYYRNNPIRYKFYRYNCGRDQRLDALWGDR